MSAQHELRAIRSGRLLPLLTALILTALLVRLLQHLAHATGWIESDSATYWPIFAGLFALLTLQLVLASLDRPARTTSEEQSRLDAMSVAVLVPAYNEDPVALEACLAGLLHQSRPPQTICVVDDGSSVDYAEARRRFEILAERMGIEHRWIKQDNAGKRHAQAAAITFCPEADVFVTVDSDSVCDRRAIEEALKPLKDEDVHAVAGILVAANARTNLLTRMLDLTWTTWQCSERSALSSLGSVIINSGGFALYRADVVRENLESYLNETFLGRPVRYSDDSQLTLYALVGGRTVQQSTAFCFTLVPERVHHHLRQQLRWMRGSAIRSVWRVRYLPMTAVAFWFQVLLWARIVLAPLLLVALIANPQTRGALFPWMLLIPVLMGYIQGLRYFCVQTSNLPPGQRLAGYALLVPVSVTWSYTVLSVVRWYGMATCWRNQWGTRSTVEVTGVTPATGT
ncbi:MULTISPECIES: glycosyltransferase family 2 protein [unclassified Aeromicrobium]|uniref:glycosyltransferase family 2 protein n=1 Tax=unclassified Aeromicrobium TaxID=2633570 RepID=UPI00396B1AE6